MSNTFSFYNSEDSVTGIAELTQGADGVYRVSLLDNCSGMTLDSVFLFPAARRADAIAKAKEIAGLGESRLLLEINA